MTVTAVSPADGLRRDWLAPFPLDKEQFRQAPAYDFSRAPHDGELSYENYGWDIDGKRWREIAGRALVRMRLPVIL